MLGRFSEETLTKGGEKNNRLECSFFHLLKSARCSFVLCSEPEQEVDGGGRCWSYAQSILAPRLDERAGMVNRFPSPPSRGRGAGRWPNLMKFFCVFSHLAGKRKQRAAASPVALPSSLCRALRELSLRCLNPK